LRLGALLRPGAVADDRPESLVLADQARQFGQRIADGLARRVARCSVAAGRQRAPTRSSVRRTIRHVPLSPLALADLRPAQSPGPQIQKTTLEQRVLPAS